MCYMKPCVDNALECYLVVRCIGTMEQNNNDYLWVMHCRLQCSGSLSPFVCLSVCLSVCLCVAVCVSVCVCVWMSVCLSVPSIHLSVGLALV